jgi:hypothetical protein
MGLSGREKRRTVVENYELLVICLINIAMIDRANIGWLAR